MNTYILLTDKPWHDQLFSNLLNHGKGNWVRIRERRDFTINNIQQINPSRIFIPHWSHIIEAEIFNNFECILFHMTDLPFGRGGSPLQNLIQMGYKSTKISALKVEIGIDEGPIYLKKALSLEGTALQIFERSATVIEKMIDEILDKNPTPKTQEGPITSFKRRKPEQSNIKDHKELSKLYDQIRMLDCEGYPKAYLETENFKIEFNNPNLKNENELIAHVRITKK